LSRRRRSFTPVTNTAPRLPSVAVIGAGIAGLTCARKLRDAGYVVALFEQSDVPGGRTESREEDFGDFDCGAQYFTARDPRFKSAITSWLRAGVVAEWRARIVRVTKDKVDESREGAVRYTGYPEMRALAAYLARGFQIGFGRRVVDLVRVESGWTLQLEDGSQTLPYASVIVAIPSPEAGRLLAGSPDLAARVAGIQMQPCWAVMLQFDKPLDARFDAAIVEDEPIAWLARESSKPGRSPGERWIVHASHAWSADHVDAEPNEVVAGLMKTFCELVEKRVKPTASAALCWRHSLVTEPLGAGCLYDPATGLGACGDWTLGGRIEGAFLSGLAMASEVAQQLGSSRSPRAQERETAAPAQDREAAPQPPRDLTPSADLG